ncbi:MAG TPA: UDP-N-acetylmuramoyl-tripeptide--D-alanyl-D-alanine ligase [Solirubrobacteraceae bacterium]
MRRWDALKVARLAGARLLQGPPAGGSGPERTIIDSRDAGPGALFVGLQGENVDGGAYGAAAIAAGAWGVLTSPEHAQALVTRVADRSAGPSPAILSAADPLGALQRLATSWRRELGARTIGITGSTGKTSTKDLLAAVLSPHRMTVASRANYNTEVGLPLEILAAPAGTEVLVLEMGMRGAGQIAELARVAEPDVGVIVSIGPVHLEQLGTIEAIAAAKAELIAGLPAGGTAVLPADEPLLGPYCRPDVRTLTFGPGGDVQLVSATDTRVEVDMAGERIAFDVDFTAPHLRHDLLAAAAAATAIGVRSGGQLHVTLSPGRGQRVELPGGITLIDSAYNANPVSMRAALDELAAPAAARKVAVLGDMLELGPESERYHRELGAYADAVADVLVTVGPLAGSIAESFSGEHHHAADADAAVASLSLLLRSGDVVLVKGSLGVGLRRVCEALRAGTPA